MIAQSSIEVCLKSVYTTHGQVARRFGRNIHLLKLVIVGFSNEIVDCLIFENFPSLKYLFPLGKRVGTKFSLFSFLGENPRAQFCLMQG